jgi:hypothetical protein
MIGAARRRSILGLALVALGILGLSLLNGLVLCDGTTPRGGTIEGAHEVAPAQPGGVRIMAFNIAQCFV